MFHHSPSESWFLAGIPATCFVYKGPKEGLCCTSNLMESERLCQAIFTIQFCVRIPDALTHEFFVFFFNDLHAYFLLPYL